MNKKSILLAMAMYKNDITQTAISNLLKATQNKINLFLLKNEQSASFSKTQYTTKLFSDKITTRIFLQLEKENKIKILSGISKDHTISLPVVYVLSLATIENIKRNISKYLSTNKDNTKIFE